MDSLKYFCKIFVATLYLGGIKEYFEHFNAVKTIFKFNTD